MTKKQKIVIGAAAIVVLGGVAAISYKMGKDAGLKEPKKLINGEAEPEPKVSGYSPVAYDNDELTRLLKERIYILNNRTKFRDPKVEGYQKFLDRTKLALDETWDKSLEFYSTDTDYILAKEGEVVASIKKEEPKTTSKKEEPKTAPKKEESAIKISEVIVSETTEKNDDKKTS